MKHNPKVSIILPVYNVERYIEECLTSVIQQTYKNIELILVNDGTKDDSVVLAQNVLSHWTGDCRIVSQKNSGACAARNNALKLATGDYFIHLDADDRIDSELIATQIECLRRYGFDNRKIAVCKWVGLEDNTICMSDKISHDYDCPSDLLIDMYINHLCIYPHCYMVSRQLIEKAGLWDTTLVQDEDGDFFSRIIAQAESIIYNARSVAYYRFGNMSSQSKEVSEKAINGFVDTAIKKSKLLLSISSSHRVNDAVYELVSLKPKLYYPYFRKACRKADQFLEQTIHRKIEYSKCSIETWIYYYLVRFGFRKSLLKP